LKQIKNFLLRLLGRKNYLILTSRVFLAYYRLGLLKGNTAYQTHYFVKRFIKPGQTVIDIGANLGYYSCQFARWVGKSGYVLAVEPIPLYRKVLRFNTERYPQLDILPFALAEHEGTGTMGIPGSDKHRHGLMKILSSEEKNQVAETEKVLLKNPLDLFSRLENIDYIKCDIEGYEVPVLPLMWALIEKHRPIMQVETDGENKKILFERFKATGYHQFYVQGKILLPYTDPSLALPADLIAIPSEKVIDYQTSIGNGKG
jgi:FkbM family methyltransferase